MRMGTQQQFCDSPGAKRKKEDCRSHLIVVLGNHVNQKYTFMLL